MRRNENIFSRTLDKNMQDKDNSHPASETRQQKQAALN